jgi:aspartate/methionine/tyrosine aminotransferase
MVVINNPNNPTGAIVPTSTLRQICQMVHEMAPNAVVLCDEVYRPLFHSLPPGEDPPLSILELGYPNVIATGSLSKAYSLAGLRVGWIATPRKDLLERFLGVRDYNVISVSGVDEELAGRALGAKAKEHIIDRNTRLARTNRQILSSWIEATPGVKWVPPVGGTTALVYLGDGVVDQVVCAELCSKHGVVSKVCSEGISLLSLKDASLSRNTQNMVPAGLCFGLPGWVRIGYVGDTKMLEEGLEIVSKFLGEWKY